MLSIALVFTASVAEQLAPARQGKLQCLSPIASTKTCDSLSKITQVAPGRYAYEAEILLDADGPVIVVERGTITVQGSKSCETVRLAELSRLKFKVAGVPASATETARYRTQFKQKFAPLAGQVICSSIGPEEEGAHEVETYLDGRHVVGMDYSMMWVNPNEGWKVAP